MKFRIEGYSPLKSSPGGHGEQLLYRLFKKEMIFCKGARRQSIFCQLEQKSLLKGSSNPILVRASDANSSECLQAFSILSQFSAL